MLNLLIYSNVLLYFIGNETWHLILIKKLNVLKIYIQIYCNANYTLLRLWCDRDRIIVSRELIPSRSE